jgi:hypothetical protein
MGFKTDEIGRSIPSLPQNIPTGKGFRQTLRGGQRFQLAVRHPARLGRVVARAQRSAGDRGRIVPDVEDITALAWSPHRADQPPWLDRQARFLAHLPYQRLGVRLAGFDPAAGQRPQAGAGRVAALDKQEPSLVVFDDGAHTGDYGTGHAVKYRRRGMSRQAWYCSDRPIGKRAKKLQFDHVDELSLHMPTICPHRASPYGIKDES